VATHPDKDGEVHEIATVTLTQEQRAQIEKATGVKLNELSVLKVAGLAARQFNPSLLQGVAVVACW
jgi:hypothetical protein